MALVGLALGLSYHHQFFCHPHHHHSKTKATTSLAFLVRQTARLGWYAYVAGLALALVKSLKLKVRVHIRHPVKIELCFFRS